MAADNNGKLYVVGKGKVYFDHFLPGTKTPTGERYFGNTPELSLSSDQDTLDHFDADEGLNVKDESITIQDDQTGQLVTDNISLENVGLFFGGEAESATIAGATGLTETIDAKLGRWVQLGVSETNPSGLRNLVNYVMKVGAATIAATDNYEVDLALGRVYIEADPAAATLIADADVIHEYDQEASTRNTVIGAGSEIRGALRFVSTNPIGPKKDFFWPYVKLSANGDFSLKGDEWQQVPFSFEVLKKDAATPRVIIDERTSGA